MKIPAKTKGFTLVEMITALAIVGLIVACTTVVTVQMLNTYYYDSGRLKINGDMRKLTRDMTTDAVFANYFVIYPSFSNRSTTYNGTTVDNWVANGQSGDMLVLVTATTATTGSTAGTTAITNLTGYYRDPPDGQSTTLGPVRSFHVPISPASNQPIYTLLNNASATATSNAHNNPVVIPLALGEANGELFYNFFGRCVMIKSKVVETGNENTPQATHTYNFTVAPRG